MTLVLHHSKAQSAAKLILMGVANHQGDGGAYPSVTTLAKYAAVTERRAQQLLRELEASGELITERQAGGRGQYKTNLYWINVSCPVDCDGTFNHRSGVKSRDIRGEIQSTSGVKPVSPKPIDKPEEEPILDQNKFDRKDRDEAFNTFWQIYPRKVGKGQAQVAFTKAWREAGDAVVEGAQRFASDPNLPPKQFIPHPATWLNRASWDDEPLPERQLTPEEKALKEQQEREARWAADRIRREQEAREREIQNARYAEEAKKVKRCEHDRIIYACPKCVSKVIPIQRLS